MFIPGAKAREPHPVYLRESDGLHPVQMQPNATREEVARSPAIVERRAEPAHTNKRSIAGGKKGAGIGAAAGGVGGLIYDVMTRTKK